MVLRTHGRRLALASFAVLVALAGSAGLAHAGTIYPTNTGDVGTGSGTCSYANPPSGTGCSLRQALAFATAGDTISLRAPAPPGPYKLSQAELNINKDLTLAGAGAGATTIKQTDGHDRVLHVYASSTVISGLTVTGGSVTGPPGAHGAAGSTAGADGGPAPPPPPPPQAAAATSPPASRRRRRSTARSAATRPRAAAADPALAAQPRVPLVPATAADCLSMAAALVAPCR